MSVDGGPFVAGSGPLPASPTIATVGCAGVFLCSYRMTAMNARGASAVSNTVSTGFNAPSKTVNLLARVAAQNLGPGSPTVRVTWTQPVNVGGAPITGYEGRRCSGNCDETSTLWNTAPIEQLGATPSWITTCTAGVVTCSYQVRAVNAVGPGPWGTSVRARARSRRPTSSATTAAPAGNVSVTWNGPAESGLGVDRYDLYSCVTTSGCGSSANWANTGLVIPGPSADRGAQLRRRRAVHLQGRRGREELGRRPGRVRWRSRRPARLAGDAPQNLTAASGTTIGAVDLGVEPAAERRVRSRSPTTCSSGR